MKMRKDSFSKVILKNSPSTAEDNFVGLKFSNDSITVSFPVGYDIPDSIVDKKKAVFSLLKVLYIANKNNAGTYDIFGFSGGAADQTPFDSFMWLIKDYYSNGLYRNRTKVYKNSIQGKINWKRTLSNGGMLFQTLPPERIISSKFIHTESILTEIHGFCINESLRYLGWLYNIETVKQKIKPNIQLYIKVVRKAMEQTYNDRVFKLLSSLLKVLTFKQNEKNNSVKMVGTYHFEYIWEMIIDDLYGNVDVAEYFPSAIWHLDYDSSDHKDSDLRPDTIFKLDNSLFIIDAKYYKYGITLRSIHLPHTDSIQKQITYGDHVANNYDAYGFGPESIYNAFVLPYSIRENKFGSNKNLIKVGYARSDWRDDKRMEYPYEKVSLLLLDTKYAMDTYLKDSSSESKHLRDELRALLQ